MIETLIIVLIILLAFGFLIWAVATYMPAPFGQPWIGIIIVILALIAVLLILRQVGVVGL